MSDLEYFYDEEQAVAALRARFAQARQEHPAAKSIFIQFSLIKKLYFVTGSNARKMNAEYRRYGWEKPSYED